MLDISLEEKVSVIRPENCFPGSAVGKAAQSLSCKCCKIYLGREIMISLAKECARCATAASASHTGQEALGPVW